MTEKHLSQDDFFLRLSELFESRRKEGHGSIFLTQKCNIAGADVSPSSAVTDTAFPDLQTEKALPLIIRATDGKSGFKNEKRKDRVKISTIVEPDDLEGFFTRYSDVCKSGMSALKRRDRSKRKLKDKKKKKSNAVTEAFRPL